jgi:hypothetical protein
MLGFTDAWWGVWILGRSRLDSQTFILDQVKKRSCVLHNLVNRNVKVGEVENVVEAVQAKMCKIGVVGGLFGALGISELWDLNGLWLPTQWRTSAPFALIRTPEHLEVCYLPLVWTLPAEAPMGGVCAKDAVPYTGRWGRNVKVKESGLVKSWNDVEWMFAWGADY